MYLEPRTRYVTSVMPSCKWSATSMGMMNLQLRRGVVRRNCAGVAAWADRGQTDTITTIVQVHMWGGHRGTGGFMVAGRSGRGHDSLLHWRRTKIGQVKK